VLLEFNSAEGQSSKHIQNRSCDYTNLFLSTKNWSTKICSDFSNHGHCTLGKRCPQSHDIDLIVLSKEVEVTKKDRKRKRSPPLPEKQKDVQNVLLSQQQDQDRQQFYDDTRDSFFSTSEVETEKVSRPNSFTQSFDGKLSWPKATKMESSSGTSGIESDFRPDPLPDTASDESEKSSDSKKSKKESKKDPKQSNCGGHRAGYDAFMTGFSFATFIVHSALINPEEGAQSEPISKLLGVPVRPDFSDLRIANRIYLVCKDIPFIVRKSAYCKISLGHYEKYTKEYTRNWVENS
jgi:target of EGR1 protein 1